MFMKARNAFKNQGRMKELEILWTLYFTGASPKHVRFFTKHHVWDLVQNQETTVFVFSNNTPFVVDPTALAVRSDLKIQGTENSNEFLASSNKGGQMHPKSWNRYLKTTIFNQVSEI